MIRIDSAADFGENLGLLRQLARITPGTLAAEFGGNSYRIGEYERGQRSMNIHTAVRLLAALGHQLAIVPLIEMAPEAALSASVAAQEPPAGIRVGPGGSEIESGASEADGDCPPQSCPLGWCVGADDCHRREDSNGDAIDPDDLSETYPGSGIWE